MFTKPFVYERSMDDTKRIAFFCQSANNIVKCLTGCKKDEFATEIETRYDCNNKRYTLEIIDAWPKLMTESPIECNKQNPLKTMVIVFSLDMHGKYMQCQREKEAKMDRYEEKEQAMSPKSEQQKATNERKRKYQDKQEREQSSRKRSF